HLPLVVVPDDSAWGYRADPSFVDAEDWIGRPLATDPSPEPLVLRYLAAFGPASATDVQTWSGLAGLRDVLEGLRPQLRVFRDGRRDLFDLPDAPRPPEETPAPVRFLPAFDNLILGHAERSRIIAEEHRPRVVTRNLLVLPTFLVDGFVAGTWTSTRSKRETNLTLTPFVPLSEASKAELIAEGESLLHFLAPEAPQPSIRFAEI
ncbi:winged helix DNA-binding domain-containing protein, partial [Singulisphaera rosea]